MPRQGPIYFHPITNDKFKQEHERIFKKGKKTVKAAVKKTKAQAKAKVKFAKKVTTKAKTKVKVAVKAKAKVTKRIVKKVVAKVTPIAVPVSVTPVAPPAPEVTSQERVNASLAVERQIPQAVKDDVVTKKPVEFGHLSQLDQAKVIFNTFPADELGKTVGKDDGQASATLPVQEIKKA